MIDGYLLGLWCLVSLGVALVVRALVDAIFREQDRVRVPPTPEPPRPAA